jgi:hypothetical protein
MQDSQALRPSEKPCVLPHHDPNLQGRLRALNRPDVLKFFFRIYCLKIKIRY